MAACLIVPVHDVSTEAVRIEQLELLGEDTDAGLLTTFLEGCGVAALEARRVRTRVVAKVRFHGGALVAVHIDDGAPRVEVLPRDVESIEAASRRRLARAGP